MTVLLVAVGAAVGAPLRYVTAHVLDGRLLRRSAGGAGRALPWDLPWDLHWDLHWGTILVNVAGSFLLGLFSGLGLSGNALALLGTGFCGGLTTYSAFAVHTHDLGPRKGAATVALTVVPAVAVCFLGFWLGAR